MLRLAGRRRLASEARMSAADIVLLQCFNQPDRAAGAAVLTG